jgi:predicted RNase H-like nuclease (RuvC/YqgF family)
MQIGSPLIIASDVNPMPRSVKDVAKSLGCKVYYPEKSLTNIEKIKLLKKYKKDVRGHKKDALAAAIKAYKHYHPLLKKIEDELKTDEEKKLFEDIATKLIIGEVDNIKTAIEKVLSERKIF